MADSGANYDTEFGARGPEYSPARYPPPNPMEAVGRTLGNETDNPHIYSQDNYIISPNPSYGQSNDEYFSRRTTPQSQFNRYPGYQPSRYQVTSPRSVERTMMQTRPTMVSHQVMSPTGKSSDITQDISQQERINYIQSQLQEQAQRQAQEQAQRQAQEYALQQAQEYALQQAQQQAQLQAHEKELFHAQQMQAQIRAQQSYNIQPGQQMPPQSPVRSISKVNMTPQSNSTGQVVSLSDIFQSSDQIMAASNKPVNYDRDEDDKYDSNIRQPNTVSRRSTKSPADTEIENQLQRFEHMLVSLDDKKTNSREMNNLDKRLTGLQKNILTAIIVMHMSFNRSGDLVDPIQSMNAILQTVSHKVNHEMMTGKAFKSILNDYLDKWINSVRDSIIILFREDLNTLRNNLFTKIQEDVVTAIREQATNSSVDVNSLSVSLVPAISQGVSNTLSQQLTNSLGNQLTSSLCPQISDIVSQRVSESLAQQVTAAINDQLIPLMVQQLTVSLGQLTTSSSLDTDTLVERLAPLLVQDDIKNKLTEVLNEHFNQSNTTNMESHWQAIKEMIKDLCLSYDQRLSELVTTITKQMTSVSMSVDLSDVHQKLDNLYQTQQDSQCETTSSLVNITSNQQLSNDNLTQVVQRVNVLPDLESIKALFNIDVLLVKFDQVQEAKNDQINKLVEKFDQIQEAKNDQTDKLVEKFDQVQEAKNNQINELVEKVDQILQRDTKQGSNPDISPALIEIEGRLLNNLKEYQGELVAATQQDYIVKMNEDRERFMTSLKTIHTKILDSFQKFTEEQISKQTDLKNQYQQQLSDQSQLIKSQAQMMDSFQQRLSDSSALIRDQKTFIMKQTAALSELIDAGSTTVVNVPDHEGGHSKPVNSEHDNSGHDNSMAKQIQLLTQQQQDLAQQRQILDDQTQCLTDQKLAIGELKERVSVIKQTVIEIDQKLSNVGKINNTYDTLNSDLVPITVSPPVSPPINPALHSGGISPPVQNLLPPVQSINSMPSASRLNNIRHLQASDTLPVSSPSSQPANFGVSPMPRSVPDMTSTSSSLIIAAPNAVPVASSMQSRVSTPTSPLNLVQMSSTFGKQSPVSTLVPPNMIDSQPALKSQLFSPQSRKKKNTRSRKNNPSSPKRTAMPNAGLNLAALNASSTTPQKLSEPVPVTPPNINPSSPISSNSDTNNVDPMSNFSVTSPGRT